MVIPHRVAKIGVSSLLAVTMFAAAFAVRADGPARLAGPTGDDDSSDRGLRYQLETATEAIRARDWKRATAALDSILRVERDGRLTILRTDGDGKEHTVVVSAHLEAECLLAALPLEGRHVYEQAFGPRAALDLKEARDKNNTAALQHIVERYLYTNAGVEALQDLAALHLDRGRYDLAALYYERLLRHRGLARWTPSQLIQATIAFRHADYDEPAAVVSRELLDRAGDGAFPLGMTRAEIQKELDKLSKSVALTDWPLVGGNLARNARGTGGLPFLAIDWRSSLSRTSESQERLKEAEEILTMSGQPLLPAAQPVIATILYKEEKKSLVIFRSHWGLNAFDMKTGQKFWDTPSMGSMDRMGRDSKTAQMYNTWVADQMKLRPQSLVENSTVGTLSMDGHYVYMIEDFEVCAPRYDPQQKYGEAINNSIAASKLLAYDVALGKLKWEIGGVTRKDDKPDLADSYFLGAPLPLDGKLYVAVERDHPPVPDALLLAAPNLAGFAELRDTREIFLAILDPRTGHPDAMKPLFTHRRSMIYDSARRGETVHLAYGYGVVVCCAHMGTIVGVDRLKNRILWSYTYRNPRDEPRSDEEKPGWIQDADGSYFDPAPRHQWKVTPPILADGKVIFAAADSPTLTCLDVRRGTLQWSVPRGPDDLYLAGICHGKALIVGKGYVRAVALIDGKKAWQTPTGMPSGFGTFTETQYYLPLKSAVSNKEPEICLLDPNNGAIVSHIRGRKAVLPGNLVFFQDHVLSQTPTEIMAFPPIEAQLRRIDETLKKKPDDPDGLYQRALLREIKGELIGAVEDLRTALKNDPPKDLRESIHSRLFEVLTALLRQDFDKGEKYLKEYEDTCQLDAQLNATAAAQATREQEQRRRRMTFLIIVANGREKQGKLSEALRYYLDVAAMDTKELVPLATEPALKVRLDRWALGRIEEMLKKATPEQRKQLETEMMEHWKKSKIEHFRDGAMSAVAPTP